MAKAYTPGLKISNRITHRCDRLLPIPGEVLVKVGDLVNSRDVVAETHMPGDVTPINLSNLLSVAPDEVLDCMLKQQGPQPFALMVPRNGQLADSCSWNRWSR